MSEENYANTVFNSVELKTSTFSDSDAVTKLYVDAQVSEAKTQATQAVTDLLDNAPDNLNTLREIATALSNDSDLAGTLTSSITNVQTNVDAVQTNLNTETSRSEGVESVLRWDLDSEIYRAGIEENNLSGRIVGEKNRAQNAEAGLDTKIDDEKNRALSAESLIDGKVDAEKSRAESVEAGLESSKANLSGASFSGDVFLPDSYLQFGVNWRVKASSDGSRLEFQHKATPEADWKTAVPFIRPA